MYSRYNKARKWLIFWCLFIGIGAVIGSAGMIVDRSGSLMKMQAILPYFQILPFADLLFQDFFFSGFALLIVNGLTNLIAAIFLLKRKKCGIILGMTFGVTLMLWICIQFIIFPLNFLSTIYFIFGAIQAATGYATWVFYQQEEFRKQVSTYEHIGCNPKHLVVYFSRMGYCKRIAMETANATGASVLEIKSPEMTEGTLGFWWCGRFGMHCWDMPIEEISLDLTSYEHVTICTPVWVFKLAAPVRTFCKQMSGKIKEVDYIIVHHTKGYYNNVIHEMNDLLKIQHSAEKSICCRKGKYEVLKREI